MAGKEGNIKVSIQGVEKKYNTRKERKLTSWQEKREI